MQSESNGLPDAGRTGNAPAISVIIPTTGRSTLAGAVESVLAQTFQGQIDVVISADTAADLPIPDDERIRVIRVGPAAGGNAARQAGIDAARGSFIALLDDDDSWMPEKLHCQVEQVFDAVDNPFDEPWLSATSASVPAHHPDAVWPRQTIRPHEDFREYMFRLRSLRMGGSFLQSSSMLFPRHLSAGGVRFCPAQTVHQEWQWIMDFRARHPEAPILQSPDAHVRYSVGAPSLSTEFAVEASVEFAHRHLSDNRRLLAEFLLTFPVERASQTADHTTIRKLVRRSLRVGVPSRYALTRAAVRYVQSLSRSMRHRDRRH